MELEVRPSNAPYAVVVDDNPVILLHATDILSSVGFSVFSAGGSDAALDWLDAHGEDIALLFTNVEIPGPTDGFGLAHRAAACWPAMGIVVSSGRFHPERGDMPRDAVFLPKPFGEAEVLQSAHAVLARKCPALLARAELAPLRQSASEMVA